MKTSELTLPDLYRAVATALDGVFEHNLEISGWISPSIVSSMVPGGTGVQFAAQEWL